ncbi:hypothetical protein [Pseudonocardia sp. GCM10023141]|uniref:hypothetical protein n=1 Tax=Pseudonocardia sp. GCM10023141 TaxID=3252653 RepID=UPI0036080A78
MTIVRARDGGDLELAVDVVTAAVALLRAQPGAPAVGAAVRRASAAVAALPDDLTARVLYRLLGAIEDCHRGGVAASPRLAAAWRSIGIALRLDPRWGRPDRAA